jgi:aquaporin Z
MPVMMSTMLDALARHWREYLIEGGLLAIFMVAACVAVVVLQHPRSPVAGAMWSPRRRRVTIGVLMGLTAVGLIYSPWGQRSGAHMNPGITLTFLVLGKVQPWDAVFYITAQFLGGFLGVWVAGVTLGHLVVHETVNYAATVPGPCGLRAAWLGEFAIAFGMMSMVLWSTNHVGTAPFTGLFAGVLVAAYIAIEAPISGMSMNPARTLGSAIPARAFRGLWIYFTAPPLAMLCAAGLYVTIAGTACVYCAKMNHSGRAGCIFNCRIEQMPGRGTNLPLPAGIQRDSGDRRPAGQGK